MNDYKNVEYSVIPYDQQEVETVLKQMMFDRGLTDVVYEGSNVSQLSSIMSYIISTLNVNTAINLQETLLPLATKRMNVLFGARQLGYEATPKKSYQYNLIVRAKYNQNDILRDQNGNAILDANNQVQVNKYGTVVNTIELKHNTKFTCGGYTYYYQGKTIPDFWTVTNADITAADDNLNTATQDVIDKVYKNIVVKEGVLQNKTTDEFLQINAQEYQDQNGNYKIKQDYLIPYRDVEEEGIQVVTKYINDNGEVITEPRYQSKQFLIDENTTVQKNLFTRAENIILGYPVVFFRMSDFGTPIKKGTLLEFEVLISHGKDGGAIGKFKVDEKQTNINYEVYKYSLHQAGLDEESNDSIKENAIVFHNTANRAVTQDDWITITKRHPIAKEAHCWGGEEEKPKEKGHIWTSVIPEHQTKTISYNKSGRKYYYNIDIGQPNFEVPSGISLNQPNLSNWYLTDDIYGTRPIYGLDSTGEYLYDQETDTYYLAPVDPNTGLRDGDHSIVAQESVVVETGEQQEIIKYLDNYKMMTMDVHYRHPLYVDFVLDCDIVKYDVTKSIEEINQGVFNTINDHFSANIEKFGSEYINSNIQRVIDKYLGFKSGITYNINTKGVLTRLMVDKFNTELDKLETYTCPVRTPREVIKCSLAFPFENIFKAQDAITHLDTDLVPRIDTDNFGVQQDLILTVDYGTLIPAFVNVNTNYLSTRIQLEDKNNLGVFIDFGEYAVNRLTNTIDITFDFSNISLDRVFKDQYSTQPFDETYVYFEIKYPYSLDTSTNIPFTKNTMPRLKQVTFIDN